MEALAIVELVALTVKHGSAAVKQGIEVFGKDVVTVDDVRALADLVKPAESYFEDKEG